MNDYTNLKEKCALLKDVHFKKYEIRSYFDNRYFIINKELSFAVRDTREI